MKQGRGSARPVADRTSPADRRGARAPGPVVEVLRVGAGSERARPHGGARPAADVPEAAGRWLLVGLGTVAVTAVVGLTVVAVAVAGRAGTALDTLLASDTTGDPPVRRAGDDAAPPPTTRPEAELAALRGRPPSPVEADERSCATSLVSGRLRPQVKADWKGRSQPRATGVTSDDDARAEIEQVMRRRFRLADPERAVRDALVLYDSPRLREVTGGVVVFRAALAELKGTLAEPALRDVLVGRRPISIGFGAPGANRADAGTYGGDGSIVLREAFRHEAPAMVAPVLFRELLHQGGRATQPGEVVADVLSTRVAIELMRDMPSAFTRRSEETDRVRFDVLLQLNTRVGDELAVDRADAADVSAGFARSPVSSFGAYLRSPGRAGAGGGVDRYARLVDGPSRGHSLLASVLAEVAPGGGVTERTPFDESVVALLDHHAGVGLCDQLVAAEVLGLVPRGASAQRLAHTYLTGLTG